MRKLTLFALCAIEIDNFNINKCCRWRQELLHGKTLRNEGKIHGTINPNILSLFYSMITNATYLDNLECIVSMSHPLG